MILTAQEGQIALPVLGRTLSIWEMDGVGDSFRTRGHTQEADLPLPPQVVLEIWGKSRDYQKYPHSL